MVFRNLVIVCGLAILCASLAAIGCKDLGADLPPLPTIDRVLPTAAAEGDEVRIDGQNFGESRGSSYVVFNIVPATAYVEWRDDRIRVLVPAGATTGPLKVVVEGRESPGVQFQVVSAGGFGVVQDNVNLAPGDSLVQTISGGTPPFAVVSQSNTSAAQASIAGTSFTIRALAVGSSTVVIGDNGTPQLTDTVLVTVAVTTVSFSSQVQPIFRASCVNAGCHPGGGAPFSLADGASYNNLVNQPAIPGSCPQGVTLRVKPFSADSSALYRRINGTTCGEQMPRFLTPLSTADQNVIRDWINQGAQNN